MTRAETKGALEKVKLLWGIIPLGIFVTLYLARPYLETNHAPVIACAICDKQEDIHPPTMPNEIGATVSLTIDNTGSSATTIVEHNLSWFQVPESLPSSDDLPERPDVNDKTEVPIGAHSSKTFRFGLNEALIFELRHPLPVGSSMGPRVQDKAYVFGHVRYRVFGFPATTEFCFQYVPAYKGLPESWVVCSTDVHIRRP